MDPFSTREVRYESPPIFQAAATQVPQVMTASIDQHTYYNPISKTTSSGPPVSFHNRVANLKRESAQPSIDSFYGGSTQSSDYTHYAI